jgi:hypothetical protein
MDLCVTESAEKCARPATSYQSSKFKSIELHYAIILILTCVTVSSNCLLNLQRNKTPFVMSCRSTERDVIVFLTTCSERRKCGWNCTDNRCRQSRSNTHRFAESSFGGFRNWMIESRGLKGHKGPGTPGTGKTEALPASLYP